MVYDPADEQVPVISHSRREARDRARARTRLAGIGGIGAALGITAAVVIAPIAQGSAPAAALTPAGAVKVQTVSAVTAPLVEQSVAVEVPTIVKNEPPPPPKVKAKFKAPSKQAKHADGVAGDDDHGCGDKYGVEGGWDKHKD